MTAVANNAANVLSAMTGVSQNELLQQAEKMVAGAKAGNVTSLSSLDAALASASVGSAATTERSFAAMTQTRATETHIFESAEAALARVPDASGFTAGPAATSPPTLDALAKKGQSAIDRMNSSPMFSASGIMDSGIGESFSDFENSVAQKIKDYDKNKGDMDADSRQLQFELLKQDMQKITQMTQALTNVLKTMHDQAMTAARNIRA